MITRCSAACASEYDTHTDVFTPCSIRMAVRTCVLSNTTQTPRIPPLPVIGSLRSSRAANSTVYSQEVHGAFDAIVDSPIACATSNHATYKETG